MYPKQNSDAPRVHSTALVDPSARIHPSVRIGPYCVIGKCRIGEASDVGAFTVIGDRVRIGRRVRILEHCMIGGPGFSFERDKTGRLVRTPHVGGVVIEDDVDLFPYVNVDRATLTETRVKRGAKIDHYAHIGHNCTVGRDSVVTAGTVMCGGSHLGAGTWAGVGSIIKEKVRTGKRGIIGLGAVVLKDTEDDSVVVGVPAKPIRKDPPK